VITKKRLLLLYSGIGVVPALDDLGIAANMKLIFSPYEKLVSSYTGKLLTVKRTSDNDQQDFYAQDSDNKISQSDVESFVGASDGLAISIGNQANDSYPAYQNTDANCPKIVNSGTYQTNGLLFDGVDDFLQMDDHSDIQIISRPLGIWCNFTGQNDGGAIFTKTATSTSATQYSLYTNFGASTVYCVNEGNVRHGTPVNYAFTGNNKVAYGWYSGGANDGIMSLRCNDSLGVGSTPFTSNLSNRSNIRFGCSMLPAESNFMGMNLKSLLVADIELYSYYSQLAAKDI
jgi:hypothetical protein